MKKLTLTIIICTVSVFSVFSQNDSQTELDKLYKEAGVLFRQGKIDKAIEIAEKIVKIEKKTSDTSESYADAITNLAILQTEKLRTRQSETLTRISNQPSVERQRAILARDENNESAGNTEDLFREALKIYNKKSVVETTQTATIKGQLAWVINNFRGKQLTSVEEIRLRIYEVESLYMQSITLYEKTLGKDSELTLRTYIEFADFYLKYVNFEKALPWYESYQTEIETKFGKDSKLLLKCLRPTARILTMSERRTEVAEIKQRISKLAGRTEEITPNFDLTLRSKDLLNQHLNGKELKKGKIIIVDILVDETGKIIEATAKTNDKSDKQKVETETLKLTVRPFNYHNETRKMRGYFYFIFD
jgi:tetratricopeptide (TPR) repeat protein